MDFERFCLDEEPAFPVATLVPLHPGSLENYLRRVPESERIWLKNAQFEATPDEGVCRRVERGPQSGLLQKYYMGLTLCGDRVENPNDYIFAMADGSRETEARKSYVISKDVFLTPDQEYKLTLGWALGAYSFNKYKTDKPPPVARLVIPASIDKISLLRELTATVLAQDLINEPSNILTPDRLTNEALSLARKFGAAAYVVDKKKLEKRYPLIHAVGKGAEQAPRLVDMRWGNPAYPGLTLVGKGVTFDGGGKFSKIEQMRFMKNDMAGAAHAMAVAYMIMHAQFPVHLRVLLPIVENSEGPKAYKPDDVYFSSSGKSVEIVNTDCEGRVIMGDALYEASHPSYQNAKKPRRIVDFGTLSWHGDSEYPGFNSVFCNNPALHELFLQSTRDCQEEFIHRPLMPYLGRELDDSLIADMRQASDDHYSYDDLLAALYLLKHVGMEVPWLHCDLQIWRVPKDVRTKYPANVPDGAFPAGIRSTYQFIRNDYKTDQFPFTF